MYSGLYTYLFPLVFHFRNCISRNVSVSAKRRLFESSLLYYKVLVKMVIIVPLMCILKTNSMLTWWEWIKCKFRRRPWLDWKIYISPEGSYSPRSRLNCTLHGAISFPSKHYGIFCESFQIMLHLPNVNRIVAHKLTVVVVQAAGASGEEQLPKVLCLKGAISGCLNRTSNSAHASWIVVLAARSFVSRRVPSLRQQHIKGTCTHRPSLLLGSRRQR